MFKPVTPKPTLQRMDEWEYLNQEDYLYHKLQWETPKRSTFAFEDFIEQHLLCSENIIDMGAGSGASTATIAKKHPHVNFTAFDYSMPLINIGREICDDHNIRNIVFEQGDWFNLPQKNGYDGVISLQTLSWLPDFQQPLEAVFRKIKPKWLALTSLFYEGDITCKIEVEEYKKNKKGFYNIYSLPAITRLCNVEGYSLIAAKPFEIDIDIKKPSNLDSMGTYTERLMGDKIRRVQFSGPLLMNWHMLLIEKNN